MRLTQTIKVVSGVLLALALVGCGARGDSPAQKRHAIHQMQQETLQKLYRQHPKSRSQLRKAQGYAVFSSKSNKLGLIGIGHGFGVVRDARRGKNTYMRMMSVGAGVGLGIQDIRFVAIFHDRKTMQNFIKYGWDASLGAAAAAKWKEKGEAGSQAVAADFKGVTIYQLTEYGLALQAMVQGYKYWPDDELN